MAEGRLERRLAAILAVDVAGYSRLMEQDEAGTFARMKELRLHVVEPVLARHRGRFVDLKGDGAIIEFSSAVEAVEAAIEIQRLMQARDPDLPDSQRIRLRIGINLGDVIVEGRTIHGEGVNVAARIETLCEPGGVWLSRNVHNEVRGKLALTAEPAGLHQVKNIKEPVEAWRVVLGVGTPAVLALPDKPSIAVLPFDNLSGDPAQDYFADGLVEDITTALSRVRSFFVIARNSSFTYKNRAVDVRQVARELGVRYVLEGSIRKVGARVRIVGQLVDAPTGRHVWADRFDGDMSDIFDLQDQITESVVGAVEPSIRLEEIRQARSKPTEYITAYDLYLRALPGFYSMTAAGFAEVRRLTNEALSIDPGFTLAKALGAYIRSVSVSQCWHGPDDVRVAVRMAREVLAEARDDPTSLRFAAQVLAYSARDYDTALAVIERSLYLNANSAQSYTGGGWVNAHASRPLVAIDHFQRAMRLSPIDPEKGIAMSGIGMSYLMLERFEDALLWGGNALREMPNYGSTYRVLIGALVGLGRMDEARAAAERLMQEFPTYSLGLQRQINPWRDPVFAQRYLDALRVAGIPE
ncbi:adenylate/guanylate cyclase domain-containing protein [Geminicoccus roseus]|uniref:adenylate/guanylate cyclase domain-containing protein n=1 Tax=Geminicoccus roseus TaxID=404900 RepID=UPI00041CC700|nr:adenylate/guanylate cyclase domain-containing protein [Geminicoccus roseus]